MDFHHEQCDCSLDSCLKNVDPPADCVNRLKGVVEPIDCDLCGGPTLHHNGACLRCERMARNNEIEVQEREVVKVAKPSNSPALSLGVIFGGQTITVTDKKAIAKIVKILLAL